MLGGNIAEEGVGDCKSKETGRTAGRQGPLDTTKKRRRDISIWLCKQDLRDNIHCRDSTDGGESHKAPPLGEELQAPNAYQKSLL